MEPSQPTIHAEIKVLYLQIAVIVAIRGWKLLKALAAALKTQGQDKNVENNSGSEPGEYSCLSGIITDALSIGLCKRLFSFTTTTALAHISIIQWIIAS